jgi:hypothetical protein
LFAIERPIRVVAVAEGQVYTVLPLVTIFADKLLLKVFAIYFS